MQSCRNQSTQCNSHRQSASNDRDKERREHHEHMHGMPIAMAYVPWQRWRNIYDAEKGFHRGTIFQELDLPFRGVGGCQK